MGYCNRQILSLKTIRDTCLLILICALFSQIGYSADFIGNEMKTGFFISPQFSPDEDKINAIVYGLSADNQGSIIRITEPFVYIPGDTITALKQLKMVTTKDLKPEPYPLKSKQNILMNFWRNEIHHHAQAWIFSSDKDIATDDARFDLNTKNITSDKNCFFRSRQLDADGIGFNCYLPNQKIHIKSNVHVLLRNHDITLKNELSSSETFYDIEIAGDEMDLELENNVATITHNVVVKIPERNEIITCDKMIISMKKEQGFTSLFAGAESVSQKEHGTGKTEMKTDSDDTDENIHKIEFVGNVIYTKTENNFKACADNILYDNLKKNIIMTCLPEKLVHIFFGQDKLDCNKMIIRHVNMVGGTSDEKIEINADEPRLKFHGEIFTTSDEQVDTHTVEDNSSTTLLSSNRLNYKEEGNICYFIDDVEVETTSGDIIDCKTMTILFGGKGNTFASAFDNSEKTEQKISDEKNPSKDIKKITCSENVVFVSNDMKVTGDYGVYIPENRTDGKKEDATITVTCKSSARNVHCYRQKDKLDCTKFVITIKDKSRIVLADNALIRFIADNEPNQVEDNAISDSKKNDERRKSSIPAVTATGSKIPLLIDAPLMEMVIMKNNEIQNIIFRYTLSRQVHTTILDNGSKILCNEMIIQPQEKTDGSRELNSIVCEGKVLYTKPMEKTSSAIMEQVTADKAVYYQDKPMILSADTGKKVHYNNYVDTMETFSDLITYDISRDTVKLSNYKTEKPQNVICNFSKNQTWSDELIFCTRNNTLSASNVKIHFYRGDSNKTSSIPLENSSKSLPDYLDIQADSMDYSDSDSKIVFYGDVLANNLRNTRDKLTCTHMEIILDDAENKKNNETSSVKVANSIGKKVAKSVDCYGSPIEQVIYNSPAGDTQDEADKPINAKCDEAKYSMSANTLHMNGHGYFNRGGIVNNFEDAVYDIKTEILTSRDNDTLLNNLR